MSGGNREFWMGVFVGAAAGFAAAVLTAPVPGSRVRENIRATGIEIKQRASEVSEEAQRKAEELRRSAAQTIEQEKARVTQAIERQTGGGSEGAACAGAFGQEDTAPQQPASPRSSVL